MYIKNFIKLFLITVAIELARCEKFGSEVYRQDLVSLTPEDTQTTYSVNDATVISCNGTDIKWKNPFGHYVTNLAGRVHVEDSSTYNDEVHVLRLVFEKIESKDSGVWTCEGNYGKKSFEMIVYEPIIFRTYNSDILAREGSPAILRCAADGKPTPQIHWSYNDNPIFESIHIKRVNEGLWIDRVNRSHAGKYKCKAVQDTLKSVESQDRIIYLDVQYQPEIEPIDQVMPLNGIVDGNSFTIKYGFINGSVQLGCRAFGNPMPNISWYHHGKKISHLDADTFNGTSILTIPLHHNVSFGNYTCKAKNNLGQDHHNFHIERKERAPKPERFELRGRGYNSLEIYLGSLNEHPNDTMRVTKYRFELMFKDNFEANNREWKYQNIRDVAFKSNITYTVSALEPNTTYVMRVASINAAGLSEWTDIQEVSTLAFEPKKKKSPSSASMVGMPLYLLLLILTFHLFN